MKVYPPAWRRSGQRAFTLLEVLVSSAVLSIILVVMLSALTTSVALWRNTDSKIAADREARAVGLLIARDIANVVVPLSTNLWPRIDTVGGAQYFRFLTTAPADYQPQASGNVGDVCYVEYSVVPSTNGPGREVRRLFLGSGDTYANIIRPNAFPAASSSTNPQSLGLNLLNSNNMAARGLGPLVNEANNTNFVLLGTNLLPFTGARSASNYPVAVEVNFSVADPTALANSNVIANSRFIIRNAGLYSFRVPLPKPPNAP